MNTKHKHLTRLIKRLVAVRDARAEAYNSTADRPRLQSVDDDLWHRWNEANNRCDVAFKKLWTCFEDEHEGKIAKEKGQRTTGVVNEIKPTQVTPLVPEWISIEVKATFDAMLRAGHIGSYRIMERMVRRIGYGDFREPSLALDVPIHSMEYLAGKGEVQS